MTKKDLRAFKVFAIKNGTVIDHIPAGRAMILVKVLKLCKHDKVVSLGLNFKSKALKKKDLIKVEDKELTPEEISQVAILVPKATINIIRDYKVYKKFQPEMPEEIMKLIKCPNPKCITNNEAVITKFHPLDSTYKCHYCERAFTEEEIISEINK